MYILAVLPVVMGAGLGMQTAINAKLRTFVVSPYLASAISFTIGAVFLSVITLVSGESLGVPLSVFQANPVWIWLGGLLGTIGLTINLLLFPKLGGIQTAVLPIFGQIIMGVIVDQFGLFYSPRTPLNLTRGLGILLVVLGVLTTIGVVRKKNPMLKKKASEKNQILWQITGIAGGMLTALQAAINGRLGMVIDSPIHAAAISFSIGAVLLIITSLVTRAPFGNIGKTLKQGKKNWWLWIGGLLGSLYVFGTAWLVPQIGTGQVVVLALFGQLLFSALIEHFGLFRSIEIKISTSKILGLGIMLLGVLTLHFL